MAEKERGLLEEIFEEEDIEQDQYLIFNVRGQEFGIQAMRIQEITQVMGVTPVPNSPLYIEGILNLRGKLVSVINFRKRFSFEFKPYDEDTRVIMVEHKGFPIGIIVDMVSEVIKIQDEKVQKLPEESVGSLSEGYIKGVGMLDKRLVILLDVEKVLDRSQHLDPEAISQAMEAAAAVKETEDREQKTEDRGQKTEDRGQKAEEKQGKSKGGKKGTVGSSELGR